jgi:hypothetical protein
VVQLEVHDRRLAAANDEVDLDSGGSEAVAGEGVAVLEDSGQSVSAVEGAERAESASEVEGEVDHVASETDKALFEEVVAAVLAFAPRSLPRSSSF